MKRLLFLAMILLFCAPTVGSSQTEAAEVSPLPVIRTVVLDPGHGGENLGAIGVAGIYERFLTLELAERVEAALSEIYPDLVVRLTRRSDVDLGLRERVQLANGWGADLFISIHFNASLNPEARGIEVFFLAADDPALEPSHPAGQEVGAAGVLVEHILRDLEQMRIQRESSILAECALNALLRQTGALDRGVRQDRFTVLQDTLMPAIVVELGFLTHPEEGLQVLHTDYQERLVQGLLAAIVEYDRTLWSSQPEDPLLGR